MGKHFPVFCLAIFISGSAFCFTCHMDSLTHTLLIASFHEFCTPLWTGGLKIFGRMVHTTYATWWLLPETAATLKRTIEALLERGAVVRNLESLGERSLPYKISKHGQRHRRGGYFLVDFYAPPTIVPSMLDVLARDIDVIRPSFVKQMLQKPGEECAGMVPIDYSEKLYGKKK